MEREAVDAIRFLAKPGHRKRAVSRRVDWLVRDWDGVSGLAGLRVANISPHEITSALESFARGVPGSLRALEANRCRGCAALIRLPGTKG